MSVLGRYILSVFLRQTVMLLAGLIAIFTVFDLLAHASDVSAGAHNTFRALLDYIMLRFPALFVVAVPMAVLLGALSAMAKMARAHEMIAAGAAGYTTLHVARILMTGAALFALMLFFMAEFVNPAASIRLRLWQEADYAGSPPVAPPAARKSRWAKEGSVIFHYNNSASEGRTLFEPLLVQLDQDGLIDRYIRGAEAVYRGEGTWFFKGLYGEKGIEGKNVEGDARLSLPLAPADFTAQANAMEETGFFALWLDGQSENGLRSLWLQRKIAAPLGAVLMGLLAAPMGLLMARRSGMLLAGFGFIAAGFAFFVTERLLFAMGEAGELPAFLAAWTPLLLFGTAGLWFVLYRQE